MDTDELMARARQAVRTAEAPGIGKVYTLAVNEGFREPEQSPAGGVDPDSDEARVAERVLSQVFLEDLGSLPSLQEFLTAIRANEGARGITRLAQRMAEIPDEFGRFPKPASMRRALERAAPVKGGRERHLSMAPRNQRRLLAVMEDEQRTTPYSEVNMVRRRALRRSELALFVRGDWRFSADLREFKFYGTEREPYRGVAHHVIEDQGHGFIHAVEAGLGQATKGGAFVVRSTVGTELERLYAVQIQRFT